MLYHYTNISTLLKIANGIEDGKFFLRAGNFKRMNDPNDCLYFLNLLVECMEPNSNEKKELLDKVSKIKDEFDTPYIISLSEWRDDLHMWNCYGDDGGGIALGIDYNILFESVNTFFHKYHLCAKLYQCKYWNKENLSEHLKKIGIVFMNGLEGNKKLWEDNTIPEFANLIKHPCYVYEKEHRVIIKRDINEIIVPEVKYNKDEDAFYLPIPLDGLKEIIIGPCADYNSIKEIFSSRIDTNYINSEIPYRKH